MTVTLDIPDALSGVLQPLRSRLPRTILESFAVEGHRERILSTKDVGVLLGHASRWETEDFLAAHGAWPGTTADDVAQDGRRLNELLGQ